MIDSVVISGTTATYNPFATLPNQIAGSDLFRTCAENYFAISPGLGGFPNGTVYVSAVINQNPAVPSSGTNVILTEPGNGVFATLPAGFAPVNHAYVSFDTVGTFQNALIVTGDKGVIGYGPAGNVLFTYNNPLPNTYALEGATVAPQTYALCPGCLFVTATRNGGGAGAIFTVAPNTPSGSNMTLFSSAPAEPESILFVPTNPGSLYGYSYFVSGFNTPPSTGAFSSMGAILAFTAAQLAPYAGQFLVPDEVTGNIYAFSAPNTSTIFSHTNYQLEGATLVPAAPATGCPATQGFWKHHTIPSSVSITIAGVTYSGSSTLQGILDTPPQGGNAVLILAHQLIAAEANVAAGAQEPASVATAIQQAASLLASAPSSFVSSSSTLGQQMTALANILDNYNSAVGLNCQEGSGLKTSSSQ